ncbi:62980450-9588-4eb5-a123-b15188070082 [Sclerotinia trifoliorum]|uniref:62980450-9588-4eb5-a123-b15188070082 n=1 Tax=Sclerotinia trifoliorum TaxID=28548 RepID=A0A8H2VUB9_9HELO|nr:62980450-9588-4eb5-a123-b15188070082 [Sclerotinia trifoliorum]
MVAHTPVTTWRWSEDSHIPFCYMDASGMVRSLDPQTTSSAGLGRTIIAPPIMPINSFSGSSFIMNGHQQVPQNAYGFTSYTNGSSTNLIPTYGANYIQPRSLPPMIQSFSHSPKEVLFDGSNRQRFTESTSQSQSPQIKPEPSWKTTTRRQPQKNLKTPPANETINPLPVTGSDEAHVGTTAVDRLMKIIQDKTGTLKLQSPSISQSTSVVHDESGRSKVPKKKYRCTFEGCLSRFPQKTHLDIHLRKHTGAKPYVCGYAECNRRFSQQGNLKTHMDRHSGERRFPCEICGKRFGQRSNLSAHRIVHTGIKPFSCRLDGCGKKFTQRGNLKNHHNKFHHQTLETLESQLINGEIDIEADKDYWAYFFNLYKNSNKGIKGRGKDRNISPRSRSSRNSHASTGSNASRYVSSNMRSCHGFMDVDGASYNDVTMYDSDASMRSHTSGSMSVNSSFSSVTTASTASTCSNFSDDVTADYKDHHGGNVRGGLVFGDRLY